MNTYSNKSVAYLDILGFTNYITSNETCIYAANLLFNTNCVLKTRITDQLINPVDSYDDSLKPLALRGAVTSFEKFLPLSDSVFVTSSDANVFIEQLSSFLSECFMFLAHEYCNPKDLGHPEIVTEKAYCPENKSIIDVNSKWYPVLFRGGISYGEVLYDNTISINDSKVTSTPNIIGRGVVVAVYLEKKGKGPKLFIDDAFYEQLNDKNKALVLTDSAGIKHFLWPAYHFNPGNPINSVFFEFENFMQASINLWKAYKNEPFNMQYFEFMKLVANAFVRLYNYNYPDRVEEIKDKVKNYVRKQDIDLIMLEII